MRSIPCHAPINVAAIDEPGPGSAHHNYVVQFGGPGDALHVRFQQGARGEEGSTPGVFDDALLAIVEDRLIGFQSGPFHCDENAKALTAVQAARRELAQRVAERMKRQVLGREVA